jgi:hypothetical protein
MGRKMWALRDHPQASVIGARSVRWIRPRLAIISITAVTVVAAASTARGACGDHVLTRESRAVLESLARARPSAPAVPPPCRGPGCRNAPDELPAAPPIVTLESIGKPMLSRRQDCTASQSGLGSNRLDPIALPRDGHALTVFRPPETLP